MNKSLLSVASFLLASAVFAGCGTTPASSGSSAVSSEPAVVSQAESTAQSSATEKLNIYTSFYPMYDFTVKIGGDKVNVTNLVPAGSEPHDWEPSTTDIVNLEQANMLVYSGAGMEHWVDKVIDALSNKNLTVVEASKGITLREGHHHHDGETEVQDHEEEESAYDPHVWTSIKNAKAEMENIKDALVQADPDNATYYENRYTEYAGKFDALDQKFSETLAPLPNKTIVVSHEAYGYLCDDYGLTQEGIEGLSPDSEPDPARMAEIIQFVRDNQVGTIFSEELLSPKTAEAISSETGAKTQVLSPVEGLTAEQLAAGEDYLSVMQKNLDALTAALQ